MFATSCWRDAFVCTVYLFIVATICAERFAMCELIASGIVSAVLSTKSLFVVRPANLCFG